MYSTFKTYELLSDLGIKKLKDVTKILKKLKATQIREVRNELYEMGKKEIIPIGKNIVRPAWGHLNFPAIRFYGYSDFNYKYSAKTNIDSLFGNNPVWKVSDSPYKSLEVPRQYDLVNIKEDYWFKRLINLVDNNIKMHLLSGAEKIIIDNPLATLPVKIDPSHFPEERTWSYPDPQEEKLKYLPNVVWDMHNPEDYDRIKKELGVDGRKLVHSVINWQMLQDWIGLLLYIRPWVEKGEIIFRINYSIPLDDNGWCFRSWYYEDFMKKRDLYESKIFNKFNKSMGIFNYRYDDIEYDSSLVYHYRISPFIESLIESTLLSFVYDASPLKIPKNQISLLKNQLEPDNSIFYNTLSAVIKDLSNLTGKSFELKQKKVRSQTEDLKSVIQYYTSLKRDCRLKEFRKLDRELKHTWDYLWKDMILSSTISGAFAFSLNFISLDINKLILAFIPFCSLTIKSFLKKKWDEKKIIENSEIGPLWSSINIKKRNN